MRLRPVGRKQAAVDELPLDPKRDAIDVVDAMGTVMSAEAAEHGLSPYSEA